MGEGCWLKVDFLLYCLICLGFFFKFLCFRERGLLEIVELTFLPFLVLLIWFSLVLFILGCLKCEGGWL